MRGSYYNEIDPYAAQWLRNLIAAGHIAPGDVDERSITDVEPADLAGYSQCHFFAGIGGWSYALRLAGWPDDRPIWTGSAPCQPFSAAGKQKGFDDQRHLWPEFYRLIAARNPELVVGEQVPAAVRLGWLDSVFGDLERAGYASRAIVLGAHSVGAPHIRQRLFWMGHTVQPGLERHGGDGDDSAGRPEPAGSVAAAGGAGRLADAGCERRQQISRGASCDEGADGWQSFVDHVPASDGEGIGLADAHRNGCDQAGIGVAEARNDGLVGNGAAHGPGPTDGFWSDADWLLCRDGKWRPVEPGLSPLVDGASARLGRMCPDWRAPAGEAFGNRKGRLKGYGNAIVAPLAAEFIHSVRELIA